MKNKYLEMLILPCSEGFFLTQPFNTLDVLAAKKPKSAIELPFEISLSL